MKIVIFASPEAIPSIIESISILKPGDSISIISPKYLNNIPDTFAPDDVLIVESIALFKDCKKLYYVLHLIFDSDAGFLSYKEKKLRKDNGIANQATLDLIKTFAHIEQVYPNSTHSNSSNNLNSRFMEILQQNLSI